jgi:hypothetical protein
MKALLLGQRGDVSGNLMWYIEFPHDLKSALSQGLAALRAKGYWASAFPEGDGITFRKDPEDAVQALTDFRACLPFLEIEAAKEGSALTAQKAAIVGAELIDCICLTPIEGLRLLGPVADGNTRIHPPVDGEEVPLSGHPWGATLCDEMGADITPGWHPSLKKTGGTTKLLGYPLIERKLKIPASLLLEAAQSVRGQEKLVAFVIEDADSAVDPIRLAFCNWHRLEYLPNKAGWVGEFAEVYIEPQTRRYKPNNYGGKPSVLRVSNNWLGLEVGEEASIELAPYSDVIDGARTDEMALAMKSAIRSAGRAFYLVDPEAAFLHMVYAIDGLCNPGGLKGIRQRFWICASTVAADEVDFKALYARYNRSYEVRNDLVHAGKTFAALGEDPVMHLQAMMDVLVRILEQCVILGEATREEFVGHVIKQLQRPEIDQAQRDILQAANITNIKTLLQANKMFAAIKANRSTE